MERRRLPGQTVIYQYKTLEDIRARKAQLMNDLQDDNDQTSALWDSVMAPAKSGSKGEMVSSLLSYSVNAIDMFLLVRKLTRRHDGILPFMKKKGRKRRR